MRRGAILADEPGLGKTWVAAAVAAEIAPAGCVIAVVPAALRRDWSDVLGRFGVEALVISHDALARGRHEAALRSRGLVIVDEAHRFRNRLTKRYDGLACLTINSRVLLVTATPVCNSPSDLLALLALIVADDELDSRGVKSVEECVTREAAGAGIVMRELVVRRSVAELAGLTPERRWRVIEHELPGEPNELIEQLSFPWTAGRIRRKPMILFLRRRLESSVAALAATIRRMSRVCRRARGLAERGLSLSASDLRDVLGDPDAGTFQDILFPELWGAEPEARAVTEFDEEAKRLDALSRSLPHDGRLDLVEHLVREREGVPGLVFTVSFDTALAIFERMSSLVECGLLTGRRCLVGRRRAGVDDVIGALTRGEVRLLVATDVGGEGLNLQRAGYVVHFDQPWSPAIVEQRNGRICRIGQSRAEVELLEIVTNDSRTARIVERKRRSVVELWSRAAAEPIDDVSRGGWNAPSRLETQRAESRLARLLRLRGLMSGELAGLLSTRQRVGVERLVDRLAREPFDARDIEKLKRILERERSMIPDSRAAI